MQGCRDVGLLTPTRVGHAHQQDLQWARLSCGDVGAIHPRWEERPQRKLRVPQPLQLTQIILPDPTRVFQVPPIHRAQAGPLPGPTSTLCPPASPMRGSEWTLPQAVGTGLHLWDCPRDSAPGSRPHGHFPTPSPPHTHACAHTHTHTHTLHTHTQGGHPSPVRP